MGRLLILPPQEDTFAVSLKSEIIKTDLDGGLPRYRKDQIGSVSLIDVSWIGRKEQFEYLRAFYRAATLNGSEPFDMYLRISSVTPTKYEDVHFIPGSFSSSTEGDLYSVNAQISVLLD
jgi:hypothetical protein